MTTAVNKTLHLEVYLGACSRADGSKKSSKLMQYGNSLSGDNVIEISNQ